MTRLLIEQSLSVSDEIWVDGDEFHYLARVRRHGKGDQVEVRGKEGTRFLARVGVLEKDRALLTVEEPLPVVVSTWPVTLALAVPKHNLMDDIVRKTSEIGVERIIPMTSERSVARPGRGKIERWQKIAFESLRQCGRHTPLVIEQVHGFEQALSTLQHGGTKLVLHPHGVASSRFSKIIIDKTALPAPICVLIGPEGGFSEVEIKMAEELGFSPVGLGPSILRIETAAIATAVLCVASLGGY
jgi:16S rRNA (uracil1498-N3)-methyltransferase